MSQSAHTNTSTFPSQSYPPCPSVLHIFQVKPHTDQHRTPGHIDRHRYNTTDRSRDVGVQALASSFPISGPTQRLGHDDHHRQLHQPRSLQHPHHKHLLELKPYRAQFSGKGMSEWHAFSDPPYQHLPSIKGGPGLQHSDSIPDAGSRPSEYPSGFWHVKRRRSPDGLAPTTSRPFTTSRLGLDPSEKLERRREQNRVAQRKFRAKAKVCQQLQNIQRSSAAKTTQL